MQKWQTIFLPLLVFCDVLDDSQLGQMASNMYSGVALMHIVKVRDQRDPDCVIWFAQDGNGAIWKLDLSFMSNSSPPQRLYNFHAGFFLHRSQSQQPFMFHFFTFKVSTTVQSQVFLVFALVLCTSHTNDFTYSLLIQTSSMSFCLFSCRHATLWEAFSVCWSFGLSESMNGKVEKRAFWSFLCMFLCWKGKVVEGVGCPFPPVRYDMVTPRHLFFTDHPFFFPVCLPASVCVFCVCVCVCVWCVRD